MAAGASGRGAARFTEQQHEMMERSRAEESSDVEEGVPCPPVPQPEPEPQVGEEEAERDEGDDAQQEAAELGTSSSRSFRAAANAGRASFRLKKLGLGVIKFRGMHVRVLEIKRSFFSDEVVHVALEECDADGTLKPDAYHTIDAETLTAEELALIKSKIKGRGEQLRLLARLPGLPRSRGRPHPQPSGPELLVQELTGGEPLKINIELTEKMATLKEKVWARKRLLPGEAPRSPATRAEWREYDTMRLLVEQRPLDDEGLTLRDCGISAGATLHLGVQDARASKRKREQREFTEREAERTAELERREAARKAREAADRARYGPRHPKNPDCPTGNPICYLLLVFAISLVGCALEFEPACVVAKIYNVRPMHSHPADH